MMRIAPQCFGVQHEQRAEQRSCERGILPDPVVSEALPVPLLVLTARLCELHSGAAPAVIIVPP